MGSLNVKGNRERALNQQLKKFYSMIRCVDLPNLGIDFCFFDVVLTFAYHIKVC